jgi:hypothetical protein
MLKMGSTRLIQILFYSEATTHPAQLKAFFCGYCRLEIPVWCPILMYQLVMISS